MNTSTMQSLVPPASIPHFNADSHRFNADLRHSNAISTLISAYQSDAGLLGTARVDKVTFMGYFWATLGLF